MIKLARDTVTKYMVVHGEHLPTGGATTELSLDGTTAGTDGTTAGTDGTTAGADDTATG
jgi:hypothetical protein